MKATPLLIWGFDGSSTNQATGGDSDCVLRPVFRCPDPVRGGNNILVMTEVLKHRPHPPRVQYPRRMRRGCGEVRRA